MAWQPADAQDIQAVAQRLPKAHLHVQRVKHVDARKVVQCGFVGRLDLLAEDSVIRELEVGGIDRIAVAPDDIRSQRKGIGQAVG